jgi:hypothetical protein
VKLSMFDSHGMIYGKKGQGKSNWLQHVLTVGPYENTLLIDTCREHANTGLTRYVPTHRRGTEARDELGAVLERYVVTPKEYREIRPDLVVVEEINRYAPNSGKVSEELAELVDLCRHYGVGIAGISRRPAQVDTDTVELADWTVVFRVTGDNDVKKLNRVEPGLGDAAKGLEDYHYLLLKDGEYRVHAPVAEMDTTGEL